MTITKVSYGKTYALGNYCSERIDLEASIDEDTESAADAIYQLRHYCDEIHKKNNPHLYQEQDTIQERQSFREVVDNHLSKIEESKERFNSLQYIDNQPKKLSQKELILQEISNATTEKQLKEWRLLAEKYPEIMDTYYNKLNQLTQIQ